LEDIIAKTQSKQTKNRTIMAKRNKKEQKGAKRSKRTRGKSGHIFISRCTLCVLVHKGGECMNVPFVRDAQPVVVRGGEVLATATTVAQYIAHAPGAAVAGFRENREEAKKRREKEGRRTGRRKGEREGGKRSESRETREMYQRLDCVQ
jgi:hypothetical protein